MIQIKVKYLITAVIAVLNLVFFGGWKLGRVNYESTAEQMIAGQNQIITTYAYQVGELQKEMWQKDAIITTQRQAIKAGELAKEDLKRLNIKYLSEITKIKSQVSIMLDSIKHDGIVITQPCPEGDSLPVIYLPFRFVEQGKYIDLRGEFDERGIMSLNLNVPVNIDVLLSRNGKNKGFKTTVTTDNPYVKISDLVTIKTDVKDSPSRWGIGVTGGVGVPLNNLSPKLFIGVGLTYDIFRLN